MNKRGRYWIFAFNDESEGGMNDFLLSFNNIDEFEDKCLSVNVADFTTYQVLDTNTNFHHEGDFGTITKWICKWIGDEFNEETT